MKRLETYAVIEQGQMEMTFTQLQLRRRWLGTLKDGQVIKETLSIARKPKTYKQVKTIFGLAFFTICQEFDDRGWDASMLYRLPEPTGVQVSLDMLKGFFYVLFPVFEGERQITLSDPEYDSKRTAELYEKISNWSASQWNIYIPDPDPEWREKIKETDNGKEKT